MAFEFNGPTLPYPVTASVVGSVTLKTGETCPVSETWAFTYLPTGVDNPLPPSAILFHDSAGEFAYLFERAALLTAPSNGSDQKAEIPAGALLQVSARDGEWAHVTAPPPPEIPAFHDRSGRTPLALVEPGLTGWVPANCLARLTPPTTPGMAFAGDTALHRLVALYGGYPVRSFTVSGEMTENDLRQVEVIACLSLLAGYSNPHALLWSTIDSETRDELSRALANYAGSAPAANRFPILASTAMSARAEALLQQSAGINQALLGLANPLTKNSAMHLLEALLGDATGVPTRIADDGAVVVALSQWRDQWTQLENQAVSEFSVSIRLYSPGE